LHSQHPPIIFRDLKPANIMLTPSGQVKLIDFGIARLFKPGQAKDTQAFGTVGYSAPEQYGRGQTDARSDVYSLGVLLHQLLTGYDPTSTPFRLPPASQINPNLPQAISNAIAAATDSDPNRRYASIAAFRAALFAAGGQPFARPESQAFQQDQPANVSYARPSSEPFARPGSQPYGSAGSQPFGATGAPAQTTGLANAGRWIGIASVALMGLAAILALIGGASGGSDSSLAGAGYLLAFLPLAGGPLALILGIVALVSVKTAQTADGRRHAILGIATGAMTLVLCCAIGLMAGTFGSVER
jgi:serine/threonine-protein kinase